MTATSRYREIADDLRGRLAAGEFPVGTTLPSYAVLLEHYEVPAANTIRQAVAILQAEGWIRPEHGRATFVVALPQINPDRAELEMAVADLRSALESAGQALARVERYLAATADK